MAFIAGIKGLDGFVVCHKLLLMGDENRELVIVNDVPRKASFADIGNRGAAEGSGDEEYILLSTDPGGKMVGGVEAEFGKAHAG